MSRKFLELLPPFVSPLLWHKQNVIEWMLACLFCSSVYDVYVRMKEKKAGEKIVEARLINCTFSYQQTSSRNETDYGFYEFHVFDYTKVRERERRQSYDVEAWYKIKCEKQTRSHLR